MRLVCIVLRIAEILSASPPREGNPCSVAVSRRSRPAKRLRNRQGSRKQRASASHGCFYGGGGFALSCSAGTGFGNSQFSVAVRHTIAARSRGRNFERWLERVREPRSITLCDLRIPFRAWISSWTVAIGSLGVGVLAVAKASSTTRTLSDIFSSQATVLFPPASRLAGRPQTELRRVSGEALFGTAIRFSIEMHLKICQRGLLRKEAMTKRTSREAENRSQGRAAAFMQLPFLFQPCVSKTLAALLRLPDLIGFLSRSSRENFW